MAGYTRTFGQRLPDGERREWIKPIMFRWGGVVYVIALCGCSCQGTDMAMLQALDRRCRFPAAVPVVRWTAGPAAVHLFLLSSHQPLPTWPCCSGGLGQIDHNHLYKNDADIGMLVVKIGGPAYRIGMGGGAASSVPSGSNSADLDFNAVQVCVCVLGLWVGVGVWAQKGCPALFLFLPLD